MKEVVIDISSLSDSQKKIYVFPSGVGQLALCSDAKGSVTEKIELSDEPYTMGRLFSVLPVGGGAAVQHYTVGVWPKNTSEAEDEVVKGQLYPVSFRSGCRSAQHNARLSLTFLNLGSLPGGRYESRLQVKAEGQTDAIYLPVKIMGGEVIQISDLKDLTFEKSGSVWEASNSNICVYSTAPGYSLEIQSRNNGQVRNFQSVGASYSAYWKVGAGPENSLSNVLVTGGVALRGLKPDNAQGCPNIRSTLRVSLLDSAVTALPAGIYQDVITLTVRPE
ncbi:hypothetical protein [Endozoicomonas atrinae]|uniref:hypothetical protein n=1 Tax=Endozoicomonas atrinae TaxID=1333660 RepID=UPI001112D7CC|nr:hypothetical protein [Endozoicomonas atrinae]